MKKLIEINFHKFATVDGIFKEDEVMKCVTIHLDKTIKDKDGKDSKQFFIHNDEPIRDVPAYLGVYFSRLLETNKDMKSICVDGVTFELKAIPTTYEQAFLNGTPIDDDSTITVSICSSGKTIEHTMNIEEIEQSKTLFSSAFQIERVEMPIKKKNEIPRFVSSNLMNQILFYSGAEAKDGDKIRKLIGKNMKIMPLIAKIMSDLGQETIKMYNLEYLVRVYKNWDFKDEHSLKSLEESVKKQTLASTQPNKSVIASGSNVFKKGKMITLKHQWFVDNKL